MNTQKNSSIRLLFGLVLLIGFNSGQMLTAAPWQDDPFDPFATDDPDVEVVQPAGEADRLDA